MPTYDGAREFKPWLYAIARYKLMDYFRRIYRSGEREEVDFQQVEHLLKTDVTDPVADREYIEKLFVHLSERQRSIVVMMHVEGRSAQEVAEKMAMTVSAVKVDAHRAYKKLREEVGKS